MLTWISLAMLGAAIWVRYPGVTYQTTFKSDGVYVFIRTAGGDGPR